jgi:hypothetical protein
MGVGVAVGAWGIFAVVVGGIGVTADLLHPARASTTNTRPVINDRNFWHFIVRSFPCKP